MAINFYSAGSHNGLFDILGKAYKVQSDINTSRGTTIPTDIANLITDFNAVTISPVLSQAMAPVQAGAISGYQSGASGAISLLQTFAQNYLIGVVNLDNPQPDGSLTTALKEVIRQMKVGSVTVNKSTIGMTVAAGGSNAGDGVCLTTTKRGDGLVQENTLGETMLGTSSGSSTTAPFNFAGQQAASGPLGQDWPAGTGVTKSVTAVDANTATSLLKNGGFETFTNSNLPDNWILSVGTIGTQIKQTIIDVQTITITGASTSGSYQIQITNPAGKVQTTAPIAFNGGAAAVQSAIRALTGYGAVTVTATGSSPDFTHTVTYLGAGGTQTLLSIVNNSTGLTITPTHTTPGTAQVLAGSYALEVLGDGATLTTIQQQLSGLAPNTSYAISLWAICDSVPAAGVVAVDLVDGIGGSVINDAQSNANSLSFNASALTTSWQHLSALQASECSFRTPAVLPALTFLRIHLTTSITNAKNMFLDQVALVPFSELYSGGPSIAVFAGGKAFASGDTFTLTPTNNRAGVLREWMNRNMALDAKELLLPSSASPSVPDSVVS